MELDKNEVCSKCGYTRQDDDEGPEYACPQCGETYDKLEAMFGEPHRAPIRSGRRQPREMRRERGVNTRQLLGIIGSIILFIGVFTPIVRIPFMGTMNYFHNGVGDGVIIIIFAVLSLILVLVRQYRLLWLTGFCSLAVMFYTMLKLQSRISEVTSSMEAELAGNPFRSFADAAMQSIQLQWGWAILIVGAGLVIASAAMKDSSE